MIVTVKLSGASLLRSASRPVTSITSFEELHGNALKKVIITCAVTGSIHTPTMTPHLPITPKQIADESIAAAKAGAAIIHLHARDPKDGRPTPDPEGVHGVPAARSRTRCDAVINITTGGGHNMTVQERLAAPLQCQPEMCSFNMGSMNFGLYPNLDKYKEFKYEWEPQYLEASRDFIFRNTFKDMEYTLKHLGEGCGTRFEFECYDVGHLYNLAHLLERKLVKPPLFVQTIFGILGGIGPDPDNLMHMRSDREQALRRRLRMVGARRRPPPDGVDDDGGHLRRQRPRGTGGQHLSRERAGSRRATPSRSPRSGASSKSCRWRSPRRWKRASGWR